MTRVGKIARLPDAIREELNQRLHNGQPARIILPWLNGLPEVCQALALSFGGKPVNEPNLSAWRNGRHLDWLRHQRELAQSRERAAFAVELGKADNGQIARGACTLASAQVFELLCAKEKLDPKQLRQLIMCLTKLRRLEISRQRTDQDANRLALAEEALSLQRRKFEHRVRVYEFSAPPAQQTEREENSPGGCEQGANLRQIKPNQAEESVAMERNTTCASLPSTSPDWCDAPKGGIGRETLRKIQECPSPREAGNVISGKSRQRHEGCVRSPNLIGARRVTGQNVQTFLRPLTVSSAQRSPPPVFPSQGNLLCAKLLASLANEALITE